MRKVLLLLLLAAMACSGVAPVPTASPTPWPTVAPATASPVPSATRVPPTVTVQADPTATAGPEAFQFTAENVRFHPGPQLYSGDIISVEVIAEAAPNSWDGAPVTLYMNGQSEEPFAEASFGRFGLGGRLQATFTWAWDTQGLEGWQTLRVVVKPVAGPDGTQPEPHTLDVQVELLPAELRPEPEASARWARAETDCCIFHYLTGTAAERDIEVIMAEADRAYAHVESTLGVESKQKTTFTLLSRLLGHGGFAANEVSLTYMDRNPANSALFNLFAHEGTHILDRQIAQDKPTLMTEGLAVYIAGGHFKQEALDQRAAALLALDRYIPLAELADNFYPSQHEIGYLEGGAFIHFLVQRFGWARFLNLYASFQPAPSAAQMLDNGLQVHFGQSLSELEAEWLDYLRSLPADPAEIEDLRLTIDLYDTLRRYQQLMDPAAYFLWAWLPDGHRGRQRDIVADFIRHPRTPENIALETMLVAAGQALTAGDFAHTDQLLQAVNAALEAGTPLAHPLAADYLEVTHELLEVGYEPQVIHLRGEMAQASAIRDWPELEQLALNQAAGQWQLAAEALTSRRAQSDGIILRRLFSVRQYAN